MDVSVSLDKSSTLEVTVDYATSDGTATAPGHYTTSSGTLTFAPGETTKTITIPIVDDAVASGTKAFTVDLSTQVRGVLIDNSASVQINDDDNGIGVYPWGK